MRKKNICSFCGSDHVGEITVVDKTTAIRCDNCDSLLFRPGDSQRLLDKLKEEK